MPHLDLDNPVIKLTGDEFLPRPGVTFAQQILACFISQGGVAHSPWGEVLLDMKGIQSDKSHDRSHQGGLFWGYQGCSGERYNHSASGLLCHWRQEADDRYDGRAHSHRHGFIHLCCGGDLQSAGAAALSARDLLNRKNPGDCCI